MAEDGSTEDDTGTSSDDSMSPADLDRISRVVASVVGTGGRVLSPLARAAAIPGWLTRSDGEPVWQAAVAILVAIGLQLLLPSQFRSELLLPSVQVLLLATLVIGTRGRIDRRSRLMRSLTLILIGCMSAANAIDAGWLVVGLVGRTANLSPRELIVSGGAIWLTNVIVFALWYWEFDRGGVAARAVEQRPYTDFLFPQMAEPELAPDDWQPQFPDYLYLSFTNATAFSPTDVMPLSRWSKMLMLVQSVISLVTIALVVARAVNLLG